MSQTQERILEATWELLEREGAAAVRLQDVARAVDVSRQTVYLNFGSRAGLLGALVQYVDVKGRAIEVLEKLGSADLSAQAKLDAHLSWWIGYLPKIRGVARALLAERSYDEATEAAWQSRMDLLLNSVRYVVDQLALENALDPSWKPAEAADWYWGLISVQLYEAMMERGWSHRRYADRLRRVVHATLLAR